MITFPENQWSHFSFYLIILSLLVEHYSNRYASHLRIYLVDSALIYSSCSSLIVTRDGSVTFKCAVEPYPAL